MLAGVLLLGLTRVQGPEAVRASDATVNITAAGFDPQSITVSPGSTVTWTNNSPNVQTIHSITPGAFFYPFLYQGESWSHTFNAAGTFDYKSNTTGVTGTVVVSGSGGGSTPTSPPPTATTGGGGAPGTVNITAEGFDPETITVSVGATVTWTNNSPSVQTIHSITPGAFFYPFLYQGESWSHTFNGAGTFDYRSNTTGITGTVIVTGGPGGGPTNTPIATKTPTPTLPPGTTPTKTPTLAPGITPSPTSGAGGPGAAATPTKTPTKSPTPKPTPIANTVRITDSGFEPQSMTVEVGTTVTWTNTTAGPRSAGSTVAAPGAFHSGFIFGGKSWSHAFTVVGTFPYMSAITGFTGTVLVVPAGSSGPPGGGGGSTLPFAPMGPGWNLVTYGGSSGAPARALAQLGDDYTAVYYWDGTRWQRYFRPGIGPSFLNTITNVSAGQPLWILATAAIP